MSLPKAKLLGRLAGYAAGRPIYAVPCGFPKPGRTLARLAGYAAGRPVYTAADCPSGLHASRQLARLAGYDQGRAVYAAACCVHGSSSGSSSGSGSAGSAVSGSVAQGGPPASHGSEGGSPAGSVAAPESSASGSSSGSGSGSGSISGTVPTIQTICCSNPIPETLYASFTGILAGVTVTLTYLNSGTNVGWFGTFNGCGSPLPIQVFLICSTGGVWQIGCDNTYAAFGAPAPTSVNCNPFDVVFAGVTVTSTGSCAGTTTITVTG